MVLANPTYIPYIPYIYGPYIHIYHIYQTSGKWYRRIISPEVYDGLQSGRRALATKCSLQLHEGHRTSLFVLGTLRTNLPVCASHTPHTTSLFVLDTLRTDLPYLDNGLKQAGPSRGAQEQHFEYLRGADGLQHLSGTF
jgi:hypothetical protein